MPAFDSDRAARTLAAIAGAIVERLLLVWRTLDEARASYPNLRGVHDTLAVLARDIETTNHWPLLAQAYQRLKANASLYPEQDYLSARSVLENASSQLIRLHQYLSLLPFEDIPRSVNSVLSLAYPEVFNDVDPVVLLLPELNYYEFDLTAWVTSDPIFPGLAVPPSVQKKVIRLSAPDATTPLTWPVLAHEFGHAVAQVRGMPGNLDARVAGNIAIPPDSEPLGRMLRSIYDEFLADLIAAASFGPTGPLALLRFERLLWPLTGYLPQTSATHPSARFRVECVERYLSTALSPRLKAHLDDYMLCSDFLLPPAVHAREQILRTIIEHLQTAAIEEVRSANIGNFGPGSVERAERLADRLQRGLPPCAVRIRSKNELRQPLRESIGKRDADQFRACVSMIREVPASPGEIVNAGYLLREDDIVAATHDMMISWDDNREWRNNVEPIEAALIRDQLLSAAMETAEVHSQIAESAAKHDAEPAAVASEATLEARPQILFSDAQISLRLLDEEHANRIYVTPMIDPTVQLGPASLDVRLGTDALVIANVNLDSLDPLRPREDCQKQVDAYTRRFRITTREPLVLHPNEFALAATLEYVRLPADVAARLEGRSSYGRAGLNIHSTAGFIDPGYEGHVTFELTNHGKAPIKLYAGARIGQLCFFGCQGVMAQYGKKKEHKYQRSIFTGASRFFDDVEYTWLRESRKS